MSKGVEPHAHRRHGCRLFGDVSPGVGAGKCRHSVDITRGERHHLEILQPVRNRAMNETQAVGRVHFDGDNLAAGYGYGQRDRANMSAYIEKSAVSVEHLLKQYG